VKCFIILLFLPFCLLAQTTRFDSTKTTQFISGQITQFIQTNSISVPQFTQNVASAHLRGVNIGNYLVTSNPEPWENIQTNWAFLWPNWIKPQIDLCYTNGGNAIRLIGDYGAVTSGHITRSQYLANWGQLLDYCAQRQMWVVTCYGDSGHLQGASSNAVVAEALANTTFFNGYTNVFYNDILQEVNNTNGGNTTYPVSASYTFPSNLIFQCKSVSTKRVVTSYSTPFVSVITNFQNNLKGDIIDLHQYVFNGGFQLDAQMQQLRGIYPNTNFCVGEFGSPQSGGTNTIYHDYAQTVYNTTLRSYQLGALQWDGANAADQTSTSDQWGLMDSNLVVYPYKVVNWKIFPSNTNTPPIPDAVYAYYDTINSVINSTFPPVNIVLNSTTYGTGPLPFTHSLVFNGTSSYAIPPQTLGQVCSGATWVNLIANGANHTIFGAQFDGGVSIRVKSDGSINLLKQNQVDVGSSPAGVVPFGTWTFIGFTYDSSGTMTFYTNGVSCGVAGTNPNLVTMTPSQIYLGLDFAAVIEYLKGSLAYTVIWQSVAITPAQMLTAYQMTQ